MGFRYLSELPRQRVKELPQKYAGSNFFTEAYIKKFKASQKLHKLSKRVEIALF
jgi:hypothetical protein